MEGLYRALMTHRVHQDRLMWSRVQTLSALQVAAFASSWAIRDANWFAGALMIIAFVLTWVVYGLLWKDRHDSQVNQSLMDVIAQQLVSASGVQLPPNVNTNLPVRFTSDKRIPILKSGTRTMFFVFCIFWILNLTMFVIYAFLPGWLPEKCA